MLSAKKNRRKWEKNVHGKTVVKIFNLKKTMTECDGYLEEKHYVTVNLPKWNGILTGLQGLFLGH